MDVQNVAIGMITVKNRYRKDLGDLSGLKASIESIGLLNPITITPSWVLLCGERRLEACKLLGMVEIPAQVIELGNLHKLQAEQDENIHQLPMKVSEKTALAEDIKKALGSKQGARNDIKSRKDLQPGKNGHSQDSSLINSKNDEENTSSELVDAGPQVKTGQKTREAVAKASGFDSDNSLRMAQRLKDLGSQDLRDAVDDGTVSLTDAASICSEQPDVQDEAVRRVLHGTFKTVKHAAKIILAERQAVNDQADVIKDSNGILIPDTLRQYYEAIPQFEEIATKAKEVRLLLSALDRTLASSHVNTKQLQSYLKTIESDMERNRFGIVCPACEGVDGANCNCCQNKRWFRECDKDIDLKKWRKGK